LLFIESCCYLELLPTYNCAHTASSFPLPLFFSHFCPTCHRTQTLPANNDAQRAYDEHIASIDKQNAVALKELWKQKEEELWKEYKSADERLEGLLAEMHKEAERATRECVCK